MRSTVPKGPTTETRFVASRENGDRPSLPADLRNAVVTALAKSLAAAWRREYGSRLFDEPGYTHPESTENRHLEGMK
jgi:hypothetical protein